MLAYCREVLGATLLITAPIALSDRPPLLWFMQSLWAMTRAASPMDLSPLGQAVALWIRSFSASQASSMALRLSRVAVSSWCALTPWSPPMTRVR